MAVPKKKISRSRRDMRRAYNTKIDAPSLSTCPQCKRTKMPHCVCSHCGFYKGREIFSLNIE
ncbi:MAG: 50S ribosomal protein L32 [Deltaproteobacteria bacterium]|nr:50S ribosomal protein L32 [Deltaproteobacteria bacterium]